MPENTIIPAHYLFRKGSPLHDRHIAGPWLEARGWTRLGPDTYLHPIHKEWTLSSAVRLTAQHLVADELEANGWCIVRNTFVNGDVCRAPETFTRQGSLIKTRYGSGGRWLTLRQAAQRAGLLDQEARAA